MSPPSSVVDPYQTLQIRRDATPLEIRNAYRRLALWYHPQRRVVDFSAEEIMKRRQVFELLAACYETLTDKDAKLRLDALLKERTAESTSSLQPGPTMTSLNALSSGRSSQSLTPLSRSTENLSSSLNPSLLSMEYPSNSLVGESSHLISTSHSLPGLACSVGQSSLCVTRMPSADEDTAKQSFVLWGNSQGSRGLASNGSTPNHKKGTLDVRLTLSSTSSDSSMELEEHYTEKETKRLFGGPLELLFRARRWKTFSDPHDVFSRVFQAEAWAHAPSDKSRVKDWQPVNHNLLRESSAWTGSTEKLSDGSIRFQTIRTFNNRRLIRSEIIRTDPSTKKRKSVVSVTSEPLDPPNVISSEDFSPRLVSTICGLDLSFCFPCGCV